MISHALTCNGPYLAPALHIIPQVTESHRRSRERERYRLAEREVLPLPLVDRPHQPTSRGGVGGGTSHHPALGQTSLDDDADADADPGFLQDAVQTCCAVPAMIYSLKTVEISGLEGRRVIPLLVGLLPVARLQQRLWFLAPKRIPFSASFAQLPTAHLSEAGAWRLQSS